MSLSLNQIFVFTPTPSLTKSRSFYERLDYKKSGVNEKFEIFSDSQHDIVLGLEKDARPGFSIFADNPSDIAAIFPSSHCHEKDGTWTTADPNGVRVFVIPLSSLPTIDRTGITGKNKCGHYYGTGIETVCFGETISFWKLLGYKTGGAISNNSSYITLSRERAPDITLFKPGVCPHSFYNPSLTYFNGKEGNPIVIQNLREREVEIVEEITVFNDEGIVDNVIISDPGGLHAFIFNDG